MRFWFSLSTFLFSLAFTIYGLQTLDLFDFNDRPGPGYFPLIIGVGLIICTSINVYKDLKARKLQQALSENAEQNVQVYAKDALAITTCIALLIFTLNTLGAIISMVVFFLALLNYLKRGKPLKKIKY